MYAQNRGFQRFSVDPKPPATMTATGQATKALVTAIPASPVAQEGGIATWHHDTNADATGGEKTGAGKTDPKKDRDAWCPRPGKANHAASTV